MHHSPFANWQSVLDAPRSAFFRGRTSDAVADRAASGDALMPSAEALFTQSNTRVLIGQAADGRLRFVALPTQVYPAPTGEGEYGLGPGMFHHFDVAMYAGDLSYRVALDDNTAIDLAAADRDNETWYADHFLPVTRARAGDLDIALIAFAPVAPDAGIAPLSPAPLPGPAGAIYALVVRNTGNQTVNGTVTLQAGDLLVGHYEDAAPATRRLKRPTVDVRQHTLILSRPEGSAGIHVYGGRWTRLEAPFTCERALRLAPGEEAVIETHVGMGAAHADVMPAIYALRLRPALDWLNLTAGFWRERLGKLEIRDAAGSLVEVARDLYIRSLLDNFNCLQTDAAGNLIAHWQGAPSHGYGTVWGIDVEPTAVSIVHACPELARQVLLFFMTRSRVPRGPKDHSLPILVAPVVIARQWLQASGDTAFLESHPEVLASLMSIMDDVESLKAPGETLYPSRYSSDGPVGRRYDYGTNAKVRYAFDSMAYLCRRLGRDGDAQRYAQIVEEIRSAVERTMIADGPFGPQISGGSNLGEDPGAFYLPEGAPYYDGEDTSSMLAPIYGLCDFTHEPWINYHRFARSLWCPNYDPEFDALLWNPAEPAVVDGTAFFSRLGGSVTRSEMLDALRTLREVAVDDATGSVFWWPHGLENKRALTRCSQGQGAWAWQFLEQWLGLKVDAWAHELTLAPRGLLTRFVWQGFAAGAGRFDIGWTEDESGASARIRNRAGQCWLARVGFRPSGAGAEGPLTWCEREVQPGEEIVISQPLRDARPVEAIQRDEWAGKEIEAFGDDEGVIFRRYGPALLWGHWDVNQLWDMRAMPLALRFVVANGSQQAWSNAVVTVACPDGWMAAGRQPRHWTRPDPVAAGSVRLDLGPVPAMSRAVAPFWVKPPSALALRDSWGDPTRPFHAPSQPGDGLILHVESGAPQEDVTFTVRLSARRADGSILTRQAIVPIHFEGGGS